MHMATITIITTSIIAIIGIYAAIDTARNYKACEDADDAKLEYWYRIAENR